MRPCRLPRALLRLLPAIALTLAAAPAAAACGDPGTFPVARVMTVASRTGLEVGTLQYRDTLPLRDREVVLTFDDGPLPGPTDRVLAALRGACAKATFFVTGRMATAAPALLRRIAAEGHTVGTHSLSHPNSLAELSFSEGVRQIDQGFASVAAALGGAPAPFFRFPGLGHTRPLRERLAAAGVGIFSADVMGYDWNPVPGDETRRRVLAGLARHGGGIVLLHDTKRATADMLPALLRDLAAGGYRLVHIVPADPGRLAASGPIAAAAPVPVASTAGYFEKPIPMRVGVRRPAQGDPLRAGPVLLPVRP